MNCRKRKPIIEFIFLEIRKRKDDERGEKGRTRIDRAVINSIPYLPMYKASLVSVSTIVLV